jgi:hypothetical protein
VVVSVYLSICANELSNELELSNVPSRKLMNYYLIGDNAKLGSGLFGVGNYSITIELDESSLTSVC